MILSIIAEMHPRNPNTNFTHIKGHSLGNTLLEYFLFKHIILFNRPLHIELPIHKLAQLMITFKYLRFFQLLKVLLIVFGKVTLQANYHVQVATCARVGTCVGLLLFWVRGVVG